ncbi:cytochrome P450 [Mollisia scopiformis]|uniref:Cytochrome P450 n=1 Tax=Mollisia scopiformis TaxID=149040 RepID=A0A194X1M8_MOLSC|nr:cytochrome P450 [Mollisia scopiformis]KUJ14100.1 cytochrome P450 [Mollisia scopiformis]
MPEHNIFLGHLLAMKPYIDDLPSDAHPVYFFGGMIKDKFPGGVYYLDMWPFFGPMLVCASLNATVEATQKTAIAPRKPDFLDRWFLTIAGGPNLFTMEETQWRSWRSIFNPGFSQAHIFKLVPTIVHEALVYRKLLLEIAEKGEMVRLDEETLWFTMDMIGSLVLYDSLNSKKTQNPLAVAMLSQVEWHLGDAELNPFVRYYPVRLYHQWLNSRRMNAYIGKELDMRYAAYKNSLEHGDAGDSKSVISLVLDGYLKQNGGVENLPPSLDKTFKSYATYQIRTFLFAGHDTTSSSLCHAYYLLNKNPEALKKLREEHDAVLGKDPAAAEELISNNPNTLNQLVYTNGVIKEAMRLFPPAAGARQGVDGVDIVDDNGVRFPTNNALIWILHSSIQRNPKYWPKPDEFIPERWMVEADDPLFPTKWAWRPFEFGPRNCIGQGLVMNELKVILALTAREFDIKDAYEEFDRFHPRKGLVTVDGERAYQIEKAGAHPADHLPCRVTLRK